MKNIETKFRIRNNYDVFAPRYNRTRFGEEAPLARRRVDDVAKEQLPIWLKGNSVLEIGVGTGRYAEFLSKLGFSFIGVDLSKSMLLFIPKSENIDGTLLADGERTPFASNVFDNVVCILTFGFLPNVVEALKESFKILKEKGRIVIVYHHRTLRSKWLKRPTKNKYGLGTITLYTHDEIKSFFRESGFKILFVKHIVNLPRHFYDYVPEWIYYRLLRHLDDRLKNGWFTLVVGEKANIF